MFLRNFRAESAQCWFFELFLIRVWLAPRKYNIKFHQTSLSQTIPKKGNAKECSNYHTIALISHASKVMLKILQARLQQYVNHELPDVQAGFRRGRGIRDQVAKSAGSWKKQESSKKKHLFLLYWLCQSLWPCGSQETVENSERDGNTRPPDLPLKKSVCRSGSNS